MVEVSGGCGDFDGVPVAGYRFGVVSSGCFGLVAAFAETTAVGFVGLATDAVGEDVIDLPDGCIAPGGAAGLIAGDDQFP